MPIGRSLEWHDVEETLLKCLDKQETLMEELAVHSEQAALAEVEFKRQYYALRFKARMQAIHEKKKVTENLLDEMIEEQVTKARLDKEVADSNLKVTSEALKSIRTKIDVLRTLGVTHRETVK